MSQRCNNYSNKQVLLTCFGLPIAPLNPQGESRIVAVAFPTLVYRTPTKSLLGNTQVQWIGARNSPIIDLRFWCNFGSWVSNYPSQLPKETDSDECPKGQGANVW